MKFAKIDNRNTTYRKHQEKNKQLVNRKNISTLLSSHSRIYNKADSKQSQVKVLNGINAISRTINLLKGVIYRDNPNQTAQIMGMRHPHPHKRRVCTVYTRNIRENVSEVPGNVWVKGNNRIICSFQRCSL